MRWNQLAPNVVKTTEPGRHHDGAGLMLEVAPTKIKGVFTRSWMLRYWRDGRERGAWKARRCAQAARRRH